MKSTVIQPFGCKLKKANFQIGDEYEAETERIKELSDAGYLAPLPFEKPVEKKKSKTPKG